MAVALLAVALEACSAVGESSCSFFGKAGTDFRDENVSVVWIRNGLPFSSCCEACSEWNRVNATKGAKKCVAGVVYGAGTHVHPILPTRCALKAGTSRPVVTGTVTAVAPSAPPPTPAPSPSPPPCPPQPTFRFASTFGDGMVLQAAPSQAMVWGFCSPGASVSLQFGRLSLPASVSGTVWKVALPPTPSSMTEIQNITAKSGDKTISITNVLFGDVPILGNSITMSGRRAVLYNHVGSRGIFIVAHVVLCGAGVGLQWSIEHAVSCR